jgi:tetratricopeptide (TPR) repeat protein
LIGASDVLTLAGELDQANERLQHVLESPVGSIPSVEAFVHEGRACVLFERGEYMAARAAAVRAIELGEESSVRQIVINGHILLAMVDIAVGDPDGAAAHLDRAEALRPEGGHGWDPHLLIARSDVALLRGDGEEGLRLAEQATALSEDINAAARCVVLFSLATAQLACGQHDTALATLEQLIDTAGSLSMRCRLADCHEGAAAACAALGRLREAHEHLTAATEIRRATNSRRVPRRPIEELLATLADEPTTDMLDGRSAAGQSRHHH